VSQLKTVALTTLVLAVLLIVVAMGVLRLYAP
jgi:hypothetical protein